MSITNKKETFYPKAYVIRTPRLCNLVVGFKGNFTKARKLSIAHELIDITSRKVKYTVSDEELITMALNSIENRGSVYSNVTVSEYDFKGVPSYDIKAEGAFFSGGHLKSDNIHKFITIG